MLLEDKAEIIAKCTGSFLFFTRTFYQILNDREFVIVAPAGRESHIITIARELVKCFRMETLKLNLNLPPGHYKSTLLAFWVAWCFIHYPDCKFIYVSYAFELATEHTDLIRRIMLLPEYELLFNVSLMKDSRAKDHFKTTKNGAVAAFGSEGGVTGRDAGFVTKEPRFTGALILDDLIKPLDGFSDTKRSKINNNYYLTMAQRPRSPYVPTVMLAQRTHEDDPSAHITGAADGHLWTNVILPALDEAGNVLAPNIKTKEELLLMQKLRPYEFYSQYQQTPQPAGGSLFQKDWFLVLDKEPDILSTFITCDTAETDKSWNDATAFGFFGLYKTPNGEFAIHCLYLEEMRVEPHELEASFLRFWSVCMRHHVKPRKAFLEKKSTGVTLISTLRNLQGLSVISIERNKTSGSKTVRFIEAQPFFAAKLMTLPFNAAHNKLVVDHMAKITPNNSHAHDDIADVCVDAIRIALIDKSITYNTVADNEIAANILATQNQVMNIISQPGRSY